MKIWNWLKKRPKEVKPDPFQEYMEALGKLNERDPEGKDETARAVLRQIYLMRVLGI